VKAAQLFETLTGVFSGKVRSRAPASASARWQIDAGMAERLPLRIMLAEDNVVNQKVAIKMLERMGYRADIVANGLEVLEALGRQKYDVVLLDVQMPEMDGFEAARIIKGAAWGEYRPRLIGMTALAMEGDRERCLAAGMDDYITKPVRPEELQRALERCVSTGHESPAEPPSVSLDAQVIANLRELQEPDEHDFVTELIDHLLLDTPQRIDALAEAVRLEDARTLERVSHSMKSACANLGAIGLAALCGKIEQQGARGALEGAGSLVAELRLEFARVRPLLEAERRSGGGLTGAEDAVA
jgi:CheY-like chemotaxis protein/HPt (histidine-containing phosphotransfer) domain-containing protein